MEPAISPGSRESGRAVAPCYVAERRFALARSVQWAWPMGSVTDCFEASWATLACLHGQRQSRLRHVAPSRVILCGSGLDPGELDDSIEAWREVVHPSRLLVTVSPRQPSRPLVREVRQPAERGSAPGVLLALLPELIEDPEAIFAVVTDARDRPDTLDQLAQAYVAASSQDAVVRVGGGANLVVATGAALLRLYAQTVPGLLRLLTYYIEMPDDEKPSFLERAYSYLPSVDFAEQVLAPAASAGLVREHAPSPSRSATPRCRTRRPSPLLLRRRFHPAT